MTVWKIKFGLKIQRMRGEIIGFFIMNNKEASTVICSFEKH